MPLKFDEPSVYILADPLQPGGVVTIEQQPIDDINIPEQEQTHGLKLWIAEL